MTEDTLIQRIAAKKAELDRLRPLAPHGLDNLNRSYDIELTYTSNAIEGNTLTAAETRMVIEHGITIGGKPLKDHFEAVDHFEALRFVRDLARQRVPLRETDIRNLHRLVMHRSDPEMAGRYASQGRYVETDSGRHYFPSPAEVPPLMGDFAKWLGAAPATPETAQAGRGSEPFEKLLYERLDATLGESLNALQQALTGPTELDPPSRKKN
jgi:Fic family protein